MFFSLQSLQPKPENRIKQRCDMDKATPCRPRGHPKVLLHCPLYVQLLLLAISEQAGQVNPQFLQ